MPATAVQLPVDRKPAEQAGPRVFRKRILREGSIPYMGRTLTYDRAYLQRLAENFNRKAFDQVPLVFADDRTHHPQSPERYRGEVKALELADGGLDAIVELTEEGARVIAENPRLGVSPRIVEDAEHVEHAPAVQHVAGTFEPRGRELGEWIPVTELSGVYSADQVIDLSASSFVPDDTSPALTAEQVASLPPETLAALRTALEANPSSPAEGEPNGQPAASEGSPSPSTAGGSRLGRLFRRENIETPVAESGTAEESGDLTDEEAAAILEQFAGDGEPTNPNARTPVAALAAEDRQAVELARADAATARSEATTATQALRDQAINAERRRLVEQVGFPPSIVNLAAPFLDGQPATVELAGGQSADAGEVVRGVFRELEALMEQGIIQLAGSLKGSYASDDENADRKAKLDAWDKASG